MRQPPPNTNTDGWTKAELLEAGPISAKTFDLIRKAARVRGPSHGGLAWMFSVDDVIALIRRAESGSFTERGGTAATGWRALLTERGVRIFENKAGHGRQ
jgi:hypothetical protein